MNESTPRAEPEIRSAFSNANEREPQARFSNRDELDQIVEYRKFNVAALIAFLLGLASIIVVASPMGWVVPALAILVGAVALWLSARQEKMGGAFLAWAGIALALFFSSMVASQMFTERNVIYQEAEVIGRKWLRLVTEGEDEIAHQAMMPIARRQARGFSVDAYYEKDEDAMAAKDKVFTSSPAKDIMALGPEAKIQLLGNHRQNMDLKYGKLVFQTYRVTAKGKKPVEAVLVIAKSIKEDINQISWIVADIKPPDEI